MISMKAIETVYMGYKFRSRLEARWAVYFNTAGLNWEYEPEGFEFADGTRYLPDFWLPQVKMWAEVKPKELNTNERRKAELLVKNSGSSCLLLIGTPEKKAYKYLYRDEFILKDGSVQESDCIVSNYHDYAECESRFYSFTEFSEGEILSDDNADGYCILAPVIAARQARFEFGQTPV
jgi:hypothetical protein